MKRTTFAGLALVGASGMALLASELVATAHAGRSDGAAYLLAISTGGHLRLEGRTTAAPVRSSGGGMVPADGADGPRRMICRNVVELAAVSVGYACRQA